MIFWKVCGQKVLSQTIETYIFEKYNTLGIQKVEVVETMQCFSIKVYLNIPGLFLGPKGSNKARIIRELARKFSITKEINIKVLEVELANNLTLNAKYISNEISRRAINGNFKKPIKFFLDQLRGRVQGALITLKGVLRGNRASILNFGFGNFKIAGTMQDFIDKDQTQHILKMGVVNIKVQIVKPGIVLPDKITYSNNNIVEERIDLEEL